jgi:hypothetical protein
MDDSNKSAFRSLMDPNIDGSIHAGKRFENKMSVIPYVYTEKSDFGESPKSLYFYWKNVPWPFDRLVKRATARHLKRMISDYDSAHDISGAFITTFPELDAHTGSGTTLDTYIDALVEKMYAIMHLSHTIVAYYIDALQILNLRNFPMTERARSQLKFSLLNTISSKIHGMPLIPELVDYLVQSSRLLQFDSPSGVSSIAFSVWLPPQDNFVGFAGGPYTTGTTSFELTRLVSDGDARHPAINELADAHPFFSDTTYTGADKVITAWQGYGATSYGTFIGWMYKRLTDVISQFTTNEIISGKGQYFKDILDPKSQFTDFYVNEMGASLKFDLADISEKVRSTPVYDGWDFTNKYMGYHEGWHSIPSISGYKDNWFLDNWARTDIEDAHPLLDDINIYKKDTSTPYVAGDDGYSIFTLANGMSMLSSGDPGEDLYVSLTNNAPADWGTSEATGLYSNVGRAAIYWAARRWDASVVQYLSSYDEPEQWFDSPADHHGHPFFVPEELANNIMAIRRAFRPLINRMDPMQNGFNLVISAENDDFNRWNQLLIESAGLENTGGNVGHGVTADKTVWEDKSSVLHDGFIFIGDAIGIPPNFQFRRIDIFAWEESKAAGEILPFDVAGIPVRPFTVKGLRSGFFNSVVTLWDAIVYDATDNIWEITDDIISNGYYSIDADHYDSEVPHFDCWTRGQAYTDTTPYPATIHNIPSSRTNVPQELGLNDPDPAGVVGRLISGVTTPVASVPTGDIITEFFDLKYLRPGRDNRSRDRGSRRSSRSNHSQNRGGGFKRNPKPRSEPDVSKDIMMKPDELSERSDTEK